MAQNRDVGAETDALVRAAGATHAPTDLQAAEALAAAMAGWDADDVTCYREAVALEVERLGAAPADGFLAAEVLALAWMDASPTSGVRVNGAA